MSRINIRHSVGSENRQLPIETKITSNISACTESGNRPVVRQARSIFDVNVSEVLFCSSVYMTSARARYTPALVSKFLSVNFLFAGRYMTRFFNLGMIGTPKRGMALYDYRTCGCIYRLLNHFRVNKCMAIFR